MDMNQSVAETVTEQLCRSSVAVHVMLLVSSAAIIALLKTASKISEPPCNKGGVIPWLAGRKPSWNLLAENIAEHKKRLELTDSDTGLTWLLKACLSGRTDMVKLLLANGANPQALSRDKDSTLILATFASCHQKCSNNEIIEMLANTGVNMNHVNKKGYSALSIAAANGNMPLVTTLMHYGGDPSIPDNNGTLPANLASSFGHYDVAELLHQ
ncbi:ankyrin repeat family A protein 2-like isoform X1 [Dysidea avara]|uniref:ankyrin repeat family A protein 2-like isoform X1 n=1 Tax=Dysidea avara TaxID=196820 RepID=UPI00332EC1DD